MLRDPLNIMPQAFMAYHESRASLDRIYTFLYSADHMNTFENNNINNNNINNNSNDNGTANPSTSSFYNIQHRSYEEQVKVGFVGGTFKLGMDHQQKHQGTHDYHNHQHQHQHHHYRTGAFSPHESTNHLTMSVPTFDFPPGEVSIITGASATGKTRLLHALLGEEEEAFHGHSILPSRFLTLGHPIVVRDQLHPSLSLLKVAYVSQVPWLETGTIRANILFWEPWDDVRYRSVLHQCDLIKVLSQLENGDLTQVGENGPVLSGKKHYRKNGGGDGKHLLVMIFCNSFLLYTFIRLILK